MIAHEDLIAFWSLRFLQLAATVTLETLNLDILKEHLFHYEYSIRLTVG